MKENQNLCTKKRMVIVRGKRCKTLSEVKPVGNINKNPRSFQGASDVQKEVPTSHKLVDHAYE